MHVGVPALALVREFVGPDRRLGLEDFALLTLTFAALVIRPEIASQVLEAFLQVGAILHRQRDHVGAQERVSGHQGSDPSQIDPESLCAPPDRAQGANQVLLAGAEPGQPSLADGEVVAEDGIVPAIAQGVGQFLFLVSQEEVTELQCVFPYLPYRPRRADSWFSLEPPVSLRQDRPR